MRKFIQALTLAALFFPTASCVSEEVKVGGRTSGEDTEVLLQLRTPREFGSTRGLSLVEERAIENVYVLEFNFDDVAMIPTTLKSINKAVVASNESSFAVTLEPSEENEKSKLMVLANAEAILLDPEFSEALSVGESYDDIAKAVYGTVTNKMYTSGGAIPMWGETEAIKISSDNKNNQSVLLTRAVARIDVGVGDAKNTKQTNDGSECEWTGTTIDGYDVPFRLSSVHVFRVNDRYALIPDATKLEAKEATPIGATKFDYDTPEELAMFGFDDEEDDDYVTNDLYIIRHIYVPEADIKMGGTKGDEHHTQRMAIVVGGTFDGNGNNNFDDDNGKTYYRLDFAEGTTLMNVLRNHLYQFNIDAVAGDGYETPEEAYEKQAINMSCTILAWDEGATGDEGFDGPYHMYVSPGEFVFAGDEISTQTLTLDTDYPTWTASVSPNEDGTGTVPNNYWLTIDGTNSVSGSGSATPKNISVAAKYNAPPLPPALPAIRTAWITVKAGDRIAVKVKVTQDVPGMRNVDSTVDGIIGYIYHPGYPDHHKLTMDKDDGDDTDGIVYVAYFKFGSLVAASSQDHGLFTSDDIVAWPREWKSTTDDRAALNAAITGSGEPAWASVPVITEYDDMPRGDELSMIAGATPNNGLGDPCDYWFGDHDGNGATATATENWRLPTAYENVAFVGSAEDATYFLEDGNTTMFYTSSFPGVWTAGTYPLTITPGMGNFPVENGGDRTAFSESLPAAGTRSFRGTVANQGLIGYYWSSTVYSTDNGYPMTFLNSFVQSADSGDYENGFAVRCVQVTP